MKRLLAALVGALFILGASPSQAHRISARSGPPPEGVSIPSLTHGQMAVIRDNLPAIRALASARVRIRPDDLAIGGLPEPSVFRLSLGDRSGSVTDEESPFNECAHAYLAAGRALLLQLAHEPGADHKAIDALIGKIEVEMLADGASMNLCRYSDEPFNTNEVIWPHWSMVPSHRPTLAALGAVFGLIAAGVFALWQGTTPRGARGVA